MLQVTGCRPIAGGDVLLFDVGVEGIKQDADIRVADGVAESHGIGDGFRK